MIKMKYAVELIFDDDSQQKINKLREVLINTGIHDEAVKLNHLSIADLATDNIELLVQRVEEFSKTINKFQVILATAGSFMSAENVLFLSPVMNDNLINVHKDFLESLGSLREVNSKYYEINNWVPHSTIAIRLSDEELIKGFKVLKENNILPIQATIDRIDVLQYDPKPYKQIKIFNLS